MTGKSRGQKGREGFLTLLTLVLGLSLPAWGQDQASQGPTREEMESMRRQMEELQREVRALREAGEEGKLRELRMTALSSQAPQEPEQGEEVVFSSGQRSLQALNPEISVTIDAGGKIVMKGGDPKTLDEESGFVFRHMGVHFETNLDPYSFTKAAVGISPEGVELGEAYATWVRILPSLSMTVGKFRQQFGVINRWHMPSLDQYDWPLSLATILGPGGLNQIGFSFEWFMPPLIAHSNSLIIEITNGMNGQLFSGDLLSIPTGLLHLKSYYDLTENTYLEWGLTGMFGTNNRQGKEETPILAAYDMEGEPIMAYDEEGNVIGPLTVQGPVKEVDEPWRTTWLAGADLSLTWSPTNRERYQHIIWRSEGFFVRKELSEGILTAMGAYSYIDGGFAEDLSVGLRGDVTLPFKADNEGEILWQVAACFTWWQSPWVKLRLQYSHTDGTKAESVDMLALQFVWSAGPHKHERY